MFSSMAVMAREAWTDARLDDFKENVNRRFDEVDKRFDQVDKRFDRVEADIRELRMTMKQGFDSMHRTMIIGFVSMFGTIVSAMIAAMAFN
jgi:hypothetical protein